jgi:hypothetical protein
MVMTMINTKNVQTAVILVVLDFRILLELVVMESLLKLRTVRAKTRNRSETGQKSGSVRFLEPKTGGSVRIDPIDASRHLMIVQGRILAR